MKKKIIAIVSSAALCLGFVLFLPTTADVSAQQGCWIWNETTEHYYRLIISMGWQQAEDQAIEFGGNLATINDEEEELWLREQFGEDESFWIGFNDIEVEGTWVWASGEPVTYTNWDENEPNNHEPGEDAAVMNDTPATETGFGWNDLQIDFQLRGIVEATEPPHEHEPMTGQKLVAPGYLGSHEAYYIGDGTYEFWTAYHITNPDCVSQITIDRISVFDSSGQVVYEDTPWSEPMKPHESHLFDMYTFVTPECTDEFIYTIEIFWTWTDSKGLPLIGWSYHVNAKMDDEGNLIEYTTENAHQMINMEQHLEPEKDKVK